MARKTQQDSMSLATAQTELRKLHRMLVAVENLDQIISIARESEARASTLARQIDDLQREKKSLEESVARHKEELASLEAFHRERTDELVQKRREADNAHHEHIENLRRQQAEAIAEMEDAQKAISEKLSKEREALEAKNDALKKSVDELEQKYSELQEKFRAALEV